MSKAIFAFFCAILLGVGFIGSGSLLAADAAPATQPAVDPRPINTKCPVSGEDIDPKITEVYNGLTYGFCCKDCEKKFNDNPEKYISAVK
jgi:YHS domain-containing protein